METRDCHPFQIEDSQAQTKRSAAGQLGALDGTLEDADLMAQSKDF